ncbi:MAG TPA: YegS/Rv2252/BmrU family lipid kinase [Gemmatimonadales bacterium]|nr:YegS/Rv2252/BmrU family lipid kinase [Gemmatimonadales bacterium]
MRLLLVTNPAAARTQPQVVQGIVDLLRDAGWSTEVAATAGPGDARRLAAEGVAEGVGVVAVFGGDGTTMQAASALVGTDVALGVIPGGTGNLLAGNLRIPAAPLRAAQVLARGRRKRLDLGRVERDDGIHYFAVAGGAGYDARVMVETPLEQKRRWGMVAYAATTLRLLHELRSTTYHITVDGHELEAHAALVLVANCAEVIPPFIKFRRDVRPDDGLLDVIVLRADTLGQSVRAIWDLLREAEGGAGRALVGFARGAEVTVEAFPAQPVEFDGDGAGWTPFTATVVPGAVEVIVPEGT